MIDFIQKGLIVSLSWKLRFFVLIIKHPYFGLDLEIDPRMIGKEEEAGGRVRRVSKEIPIIVVHDIMRFFNPERTVDEIEEIFNLLSIEE